MVSKALGFDVPFNNLLVSKDLSIFRTCTEFETPYRSNTYSDDNAVAKVTLMVKLPSFTGDCMFGSPVIAVTRLIHT